MREELVEHLRCPRTGAPLRLEVAEREGAEILGGWLVSEGGERYPIRGGLPRFVADEELTPDQAQTIRTFSWKWAEIPDYAEEPGPREHREAWWHERYGFDRGGEALRAFLSPRARILEAGVGQGVDTARFLRASQATIFGVDLAEVVDIARGRFRGEPRVHIAQADLGALPFPPAWFDLISCDQVLHHTPDPPAWFQRLVRHLAPGGHVLLYVYRRKGPLREFADDHLRQLCVDAPNEQVMDLCRRLARLGRSLAGLQAMVEVEDDLPELGITRGRYDVQRLIYDHMVKCFWNEDYSFETNAKVGYDWYRPRHAFRYAPEQVREWCQAAGLVLEREHLAPSGITVIARRPLAP